MARLCERPGCSNVAGMAYGFDADRLLVWLATRDPDGDPLTAGALCTRHADAMVVPRGWTLDDRRQQAPRLFKAATGAGERPARKRRGGKTQIAAPVEQLLLDEAPATTAADTTVAVVSGTTSGDDPDATAAIPWVPDFDDDDDLGGVLAVDSPLLARAFRGTDRPR